MMKKLQIRKKEKNKGGPKRLIDEKHRYGYFSYIALRFKDSSWVRRKTS